MATTKVGPAPDVQFLEEEELLEGLVQLTGGKLGIAHALLQEVIEKTDQELKKTLQGIKADIPAAGHGGECRRKPITICWRSLA